MLQSYAQNRAVPSFIKEILVHVNPQIDTNTVIVGDFNTLVLPIDKASGKNINREIWE